jgi:hypothetical protein
VAVRPLFELDRRMCDVLYEMNDDRSAALLDRNEASDTEEIGPRNAVGTAIVCSKLVHGSGFSNIREKLQRLCVCAASPKSKLRRGDSGSLSRKGWLDIAIDGDAGRRSVKRRALRLLFSGPGNSRSLRRPQSELSSSNHSPSDLG